MEEQYTPCEEYGCVMYAGVFPRNVCGECGSSYDDADDWEHNNKKDV